MKSIFKPFLAVLVGLAMGLAVTAAAGESPLHVLLVLIKSAFGSPYDIGMTLFYTTPLILTGLSVSIAFHAGLFNIGAEGQLTLGALAAATVGACFPHLSQPWAPLLGAAAAFFAGAAWGWIPGWLRVSRGGHEVINTIMLNFIAVAFASWFTLDVLKNPESQNPETLPVGQGYLLSHPAWLGDSPVSVALPMALLVAVGTYYFLSRSVLGFELRSVGQSESAARTAGVNSGKMRILAMTLAGGVAGLVGVGEVLGNAGRFRPGFSADFGFTGIAVALLGRNRPGGIVAAALLFGALHKGTADLDMETEHVTRDLSLVLQALIVISVSAEALWSGKLIGRFSKKLSKKEKA